MMHAFESKLENVAHPNSKVPIPVVPNFTKTEKNCFFGALSEKKLRGFSNLPPLMIFYRLK